MKIIVPIKLEPLFKLKLQMLAHDNKMNDLDNTTVASLMRTALYKAFPILSENMIEFTKQMHPETKKKFEKELGGF